MSEFKVGDLVRVKDDAFAEGGVNTGDIGTVVEVWEDTLGVDVGVGQNRGQFYNYELAYAPADPEPDVIAHPNHYTSGLPEGVEVIDIIRAQGAGWEHSNAIKYLLRAQYKGNYKQDIAKAIQYLTWAAERWED